VKHSIQRSPISLTNPLSVYFPHTGQRVGNWTILGHQIADLQVRDSPPPPPVHQDQYNQSQPPSHRPSIVEPLQPMPNIPTPQPPAEDFQDPAILSFARKPSQMDALQSPQEAPSTPVKITPSIIESLPQGPTSPAIGTPQDMGKKKTVPRKKGKDAAATLKAPFSNLDINSAAEQEHLDESDDPTVRDETVRRVSVTKTRTGKPMDDAPQFVEPKAKTRRKKQDWIRTMVKGIHRQRLCARQTRMAHFEARAGDRHLFSRNHKRLPAHEDQTRRLQTQLHLGK
jgi:enhancer of mRNA-decapping protein 3